VVEKGEKPVTRGEREALLSSLAGQSAPLGDLQVAFTELRRGDGSAPPGGCSGTGSIKTYARSLQYRRYLCSVLFSNKLFEPTTLSNFQNKVIQVPKSKCRSFYDIDLVIESFTCCICIAKVKIIHNPIEMAFYGLN